MKQKENNHKAWGLIPVILATVILWFLYSLCLRSYNDKFDQINQNIKDKTTIVLSANTDSVLLKQIIYDNGYCETERDAAFIAKKLVDRLQNGEMEDFNNLYALQKRANGQVSAHIADSCQVLSTGLLVSREKIGLTNDDNLQYDSPMDSGLYSISVVVEQELEKTSRFQLRTRKVPCVNVPVRLQMHFRDSVGDPQLQLLGYVFTNQDGIATFDGLCADSSYSVLPIREGYEYGQSKGVVGGEWIIHRIWYKKLINGVKNRIHNTKDNEFRFIEKEHRIPLLSNTALRQIKTERTIIVRTPDEFKNELVKSRHVLFLSWWVLTIVLTFFFRRGKRLLKREFDFSSGLIVACCMLLTGLSVLMMFSMVDPVNDELKGWDMAVGVMFGVGLTIILLFFDFVKRINHETFPFKAYNSLKKHHFRGLGWLVMALLLTGLLFTPLGKDVGGMRVNLKIPFIPLFQPSEIAKYLIVLFFAIFFVENNDRIIHYSGEFDTSLKEKRKVLGWMICGLVGLMIIYVVLGDMGPGLVLGISFTLLYSFCKSIQDLRDDGNTRRKNWLKCDLMMLVYGIISYALLLFIFRRLGMGHWYFWGTGAWLVVWVLSGVLSIRKSLKAHDWIWKKQFHETAIIMNLVIFVFILGNNASSDFGILNRLENRTSMCTNTWGGMDKIFQDVKHGVITQDTLSQDTLISPVSNTQVANGLWALAAGGPKGQGWGNGKPSVIPAFHTDMILSSIGEQRGFKGLCFVIVLYLVLLISVGWKGKKAGDPFVLFFCMGVAIVTAVQLFVIALGSAGAIPLTGVTVPFLSYGRVSMILNIVAFGFVLSLVTREDPITIEEHIKAKKNYVESSKWTLRVAVVMLAAAALFTLGVWAKYQLLQRKKTLLQPAFVININGDPVLEYNPRIALITNEMYTGRIFDRNGLLLATSNKDDISGKIQDSLIKCGINIEDLDALKRRHLKRYYPFAEQLFFMVGDQNTKLLFSYDESKPVGYMAEFQYLSYLRGFDNRLLDKNKNQAKVCLVTEKKRDNRFLKPKTSTTGFIPLYDYTALLPYLKDGTGKRLEKHNSEVVENGKYDLYLTVDAAMQKNIQDKLEDYIPNNYKNKEFFNLMRVSVVVLNAKNGDLLASANYPKPNYDRLSAELEIRSQEKKDYYYDGDKNKTWMAYTDRDLGATYQTAPGSTAKVMSAMAGLRNSFDNKNERYIISSENAIEKNSKGEPVEPTGTVSMKKAIVSSSNCYFINLVNDKDLYSDLSTIYSSVGVRIGETTPYFYTFKDDKEWEKSFYQTIDENKKIALARYNNFKNNDYKGSMNKGEWEWAWGQGYSVKKKENGKEKVISYDLAATPLAMARVAATVVNNGEMPVVQYIRPSKNHKLRDEKDIPLMSKEAADTLKGYMMAESIKDSKLSSWTVDNNKKGDKTNIMGGKTGTAERGSSYGKINDGWYVCFVERGPHRLAIVVRMERIGKRGIYARNTAVPLVDELLKTCIIKSESQLISYE